MGSLSRSVLVPSGRLHLREVTSRGVRLLSRLEASGEPDVCFVDDRLTALIHQELVERGHLNQFLSNLGVLQDETGLKPALLLQHVPETFTQQAQERQTSSDRPPIDLAPDNIRPKHVHKYQAQLDLFTATASNASHSTAADIETLTAQRSWDLNNADAVEVAAPPAISVLDAAVAAYKQEKRRLWKVCLRHTLHTVEQQVVQGY